MPVQKNIIQFQCLFMAPAVTFIAFILTLLAPQIGSAQTPHTACTTDFEFAQTIDGPRSFNETEFLAQNHNIGLYRGGPITLRPWVDTGEHSTVGIDQNGNVVQHLEFTDKHGTPRRVAAFLSTGQVFSHVFMTTTGQLFAIDKTGELHVFSWERWRTNKALNDLARIKKLWLTSVCGLNAVAAVATLLHSALTGTFHPEYMLGSVVGSIGLTMTHLTLAARKYEVANENTNGFIATGIKLSAPAKSMQYVWKDDQTGIRDFELYLESRERVSLAEGLKMIVADQLPMQTEFKDFDVKCEHALLARGIPETSWEGAWKKRK